MQLPAEFSDKMKKLLGEEYPKYLTSMDEPRLYGLRVNTGKISTDDFMKITPFHITPIPWIENGFYYDGENVSPSRHPYYYAGLYYLQEPSAMTPANRLPVKPGERILDMCAAPGGKATELGAKIGRDGLLVANDISSSRLKGLLKNIEVYGVGNILVTNEDPKKLSCYFAEYFDKILIDAPCSGEGMFRKDKKMIPAWQEHGPVFFSKIQKNIIIQGAKMLKPGGMMLYSTCTFSPEENEEVISHLLESQTDFEVCPVRGYTGFSCGLTRTDSFCNDSLSKTVRIFPHRMKGEGHYIALIKKGAAPASKDLRSHKYAMPVKPKQGLSAEFDEFLNKISYSFDYSRFEIRTDKVYYMPEYLPNLNGIRFLRTGLLMGEIKKKRFEPSQALAMYLKKEEYAFTLDLPAADPRVLKYLKGETIDVCEFINANEKDWYLMCVDGFPLGWGKVQNGVMKNKYLPGWRYIGG